MQIVVHDNKMRKVALLNNKYPDMLSFHSDTWHRYLLQATSTFDFTVPKIYNGKLHEDLGFINDKAYFSFKFQGKHHLFYVANITEDDFNITLNCNNTNLELINEQSIPFTSNSAQNIAWYLQHMELLTYATLEIGINEVADKTRTLTFESQETKLSRLQSLMSRFNAEFEFVTELNNNGTLKRIVLNIYHEADNEHHGIGKVRSDVVLRYGNDVKGVQVTTDKTQLFNTGVFTGADGLTLKDVERSDKNTDGVEEFYTRKGNVSVYAPLSAEQYPASMKEGDNWTRKDFQTEYTNVNDLLAYAFRTLKQYAYPIVTYTANIQSNFLNDYQDLVLGDTVKIYDKNFVGGLILRARVTEQVISFSNPNNNTLTFSNYVKLDSKISDTLRNRMAEMIEARLPYTLKMSTSAGTSFKNGTGESIVTPELYRGQKKITDATYRYYFGSEMITGQTYKVLASKIENKQILTVAAYVGNDEVARDKLTFINVSDGTQGVPGEKGADGKTPYIHFAYAESADGKQGFSTTQTGNKRYIGTYTDYTQADSTDPTKYKWVDMVGTVEVGGRNYIRHYDWNTLLPLSMVEVIWKFERIADPQAKSGYMLKATCIKGGSGGFHKPLVDLKGLEWQGKQLTWSWDIKTSRTMTFTNIGFEMGGLKKDVPITTSWKRLSHTFKVTTHPKGLFSCVFYANNFQAGDIVYLRDPQLEDGTIATTPNAAPEDVEDNINSKADQSLTQEQLNALNEKNSIIQAELDAKASLDTINSILKQLQDFKKVDEATWEKSNKDLISHLQRIIKIETNLGDMAQRWNSIDTFMQISNDGLSLGKNDGSSSMLFSPEGRITMFSSGSPVMYVDKGVIHIENGIFSKTVQIGRFREEQYHLNPDMNVIRYVGGV